MPTEEAIAEWIESSERKFGQFINPARYGTPSPNPGNGMWREDAKKWATKTPEQKREWALLCLRPHKPDPVNTRYCEEVARDSMDFQHGMGRQKFRREDRR